MATCGECGNYVTFNACKFCKVRIVVFENKIKILEVKRMPRDDVRNEFYYRGKYYKGIWNGHISCFEIHI